ncbi:hypothetical protein ACFWXK_10240 [Streptomyces sp. NPDC059070]|uniref:hypothetical protein n=1 Tax=Streptomyces sp. NPDC059070 TaxID=3346713 RepID=UPI0036D0CB54
MDDMTVGPQENRPFLPQDFEDPCEDCGAPAGSYCRPGCGSGYTAADARADAHRPRSLPS